MADVCIGTVWVCEQRGMDDKDHPLFLLLIDGSRYAFRRLSIRSDEPDPRQGDRGVATWDSFFKVWRFVPIVLVDEITEDLYKEASETTARRIRCWLSSLVRRLGWRCPNSFHD